MADGKGLFRVKMTCTGVSKELYGMLLHGWASKLQPSGTQLRGFWHNFIALAHL